MMIFSNPDIPSAMPFRANRRGEVVIVQEQALSLSTDK